MPVVDPRYANDPNYNNVNDYISYPASDPVLDAFEPEPPTPYAYWGGLPAYKRTPANVPSSAYGQTPANVRSPAYGQTPANVPPPPPPSGYGRSALDVATPPPPSGYGRSALDVATPPTGPSWQAAQPSAFTRKPDPKKGQSRLMLAKGDHYDDEERKGVKYVTTQRQKYQVEMGAKMRRRGNTFDTKKISLHYERKEQGRDKYQLGSANLGKSRKTGQLFYPPDEWRHALIWVCAVDPNTDRPVFYSHVCKVRRFHHSSLVAGGDVIAAGEWIVTDGKLRKISANSGHYQPELDFFYRAVLHMATAFQADTTVFLYDSVDDKWVDYPVREFIRAPSKGGRYWPHPRAPLK